MNKKHSNQLAKESSPYLLQHAHNPVDWYAWKPEAFAKAKAENKPILVSIGYSTCHWCHVMERESFENEEVARFMNENFVNIKVDREERPDVDQIYMEAVQALSGSGGWPLNCFLTPDGRPFYGGTYFPPQSAYNRPSWLTVLNNIAKAYREKPATVESQAERLMGYIQNAEAAFVSEVDFGIEPKTVFTPELIQNIYYAIRAKFDRLEGGFGTAPKFPGTMGLKFILDYHYQTGNPEALEHFCFSLDKMIQGGIYDQLGGGFSRYATDRAWLVPHFEKMLYDNALLLGLLADAYKLTKKDLYKETIIETLNWLEREMTSPEGGFYAALDADSEGVEGKFYVWDKNDIEAVLGKDAATFCAFYQVTEKGNWEEKNILWREKTFEEFSQIQSLDVSTLKGDLTKNRHALLLEREKRIRPGLDDKVLLGWNALMCTAIAKAYEALQDKRYLDLAKRSLAFILNQLSNSGELPFFHTYKDGHKQYNAFLDDYAYLIEALINMHTVTQDLTYLDKADELCAYVIEHFFDREKKLFFYTSAQQTDLVLRKKELFDGASPSGNSMMLSNLQQLALLMGKPDYQAVAEKMLLIMVESIEKYPSSFSLWAQCAARMVYPIKEIAVIGEEAAQKAQSLLSHFIPNRVLMASPCGDERYPLIADKEAEDETLLFLCEGNSCKMPVNTVKELLILIKS